MLGGELLKGTQQYRIINYLDKMQSDEVVVKCENKNEIKRFFQNAMNNNKTISSLRRVLNSTGLPIQRSKINGQTNIMVGSLDKLYSKINDGKFLVVLKNNKLKIDPKSNKKEKEEFDLLNLSAKYIQQLKQNFSTLIHRDYSILETVYTFDENSKSPIVPIVKDISTVKEHSSGWKAIDDPFEIAAWGAFKSLVAFNVALYGKFGTGPLGAAAIEAVSEHSTGQYCMFGKSITCRRWYGSYAIRFNLKTRRWEIPWVKYKKSGPNERRLVELKRKDRIMLYNKVETEYPARLIPPFMLMDDFLKKVKFPLPEHDINKPITIGVFF